MIVLLSLVLAGCGLLNTKSSSSKGLGITFALTDTTGKPSSTFYSGEPFLLSFAMINNTGNTLVAHYPPTPTVSFEILQGDSVLVSSKPEQTGPTRVHPNSVIEAMLLQPGDTLHAQWKAPNTPSQNSAIVLLDGDYKAQVSFPSFDKTTLDTVEQIKFSVVQ